MRINLGDGKFTAAIDSVGAELRSFRHTATQDEMIWIGDPAFWHGSAPILFPVIGRVKDGHYTWRGKTWEMLKHGLIRKLEWTVVKQTATEAVFRIVDNDYTRRYYPAAFSFDAGFTLTGNSMQVSYRVVNTGSEPMLFCVGSHPGINLPLEGTRLEDYYLEFNRPEHCPLYRLAPVDLVSTKPERILNGKVRIPLTQELFRDDALYLFGIASDEITVGNDRTGRAVKFHTGGVPDLGLWAAPGAPYVCIEPWFGHDDFENHDGIFEHKPDILTLAPGAEFHTGYAISPARCQ